MPVVYGNGSYYIIACNNMQADLLMYGQMSSIMWQYFMTNNSIQSSN